MIIVQLFLDNSCDNIFFSFLIRQKQREQKGKKKKKRVRLQWEGVIKNYSKIIVQMSFHKDLPISRPSNPHPLSLLISPLSLLVGMWYPLEVYMRWMGCLNVITWYQTWREWEEKLRERRWLDWTDGVSKKKFS